MWTDRFTKDELGVINACRNNELWSLRHIYGDTGVFSILENIVMVMAHELDKEASWNHSFRFREGHDNE
jgi:hypothetical protein